MTAAGQPGPPGGVRVSTLCLAGTRVIPVELELQFTGGLMQRIIMTGLPGGAVREARDRIRGCLEQCGLPMPRKSVLVNFAPADVPKLGNGFDLPLALGLLALTEQLDVRGLAGRIVLGELALNGRLRPVRGGLALAIDAARRGAEHLMLPAENGPEASLVTGLSVEAVATLAQALDVMAGHPPPPIAAARVADAPRLDLSDVRGQLSGRRALEIAATGRHNLLLHGPPGTGKTMLAQRLPSLLPGLDEAATLEVSALHGLAGGGPTTILRYPPFRAPHHTISRAGLVGGGTPLLPGEVALAHHGVLFLDEMAEFPRSLLEALRQPLEDGVVRLARAGHSQQFASRFQLVGATNPCPCGYQGHPRRGCTCTPIQVARYQRRLSGPLLDRFDLGVAVPPPPTADWFDAPRGENSATVAARVATAVALRPSVEDSPGQPSVRRVFERAIDAYALSGRAVVRLLSVARSIAALDQRTGLVPDDVEEALSFRVALLSPA